MHINLDKSYARLSERAFDVEKDSSSQVRGAKARGREEASRRKPKAGGGAPQAELKAAAEQQEAARRQQGEEQARQEAQAATSHVKPRYDEVLAQVSAQDEFWNRMESQLRSAGHGLRPEIRYRLTTIHSKVQECSTFMTNLQATEAGVCLDQVDKALNDLEAFK